MGVVALGGELLKDSNISLVLHPLASAVVSKPEGFV